VLGRVDGEPVERPLEALGRLGAGHPYARLPAGTLAAAAEWWRGRFADGPLAPYAYTGTVEASLPLPSPVGAVRRSALVPETMAAGDLRRGEPLCIVGLRPLRDFHAPYAADNLARQGYEARAKVLDLAPEPRPDVNSLGYARAFDDAAFRDRVVAELRGRLAPGESAGFPAVLGLRRPHAAWDDLERRLARRVFEIPTLPPSVPGMRVFATRRERLRRAGIQVDDGLRPLGPDGARAAENVLVAGALLAGAEPWREGSGDGISLGTGFHAGGIVVGARTEAADTTNTSGSIEAIERSGARGAGA
jgi:glycerol-3-phosphate dehydrogenase subunit B